MEVSNNYFENLSFSRLANGNKSALLLSSGEVYTFGGDEPQYDDQYNETRLISYPKLLKFPLKIIQLCIGNAHSLFLTSINTVYGIGSNQFGQLGVQPRMLQFTETMMELDLSALNNKEIKQIQTGIAGGTNILSTDGIVYTAGELCGREYNPDEPHYRILPVSQQHFQNETIRSVHEGGCVKIFISTSGAVYVVGYNSNAEASGIVGLGPTSQHSVSLPTKINSLWDNNIKIVKGSAGRYHCIVIDDQGHLYGWGGNRSKALGLPSLPDVDSPTLIPITKPQSSELETCCSVSCSWMHSLVLTDKGKVYGFGCNSHGQLGLGNTSPYVDIPTMVQIEEPVLYICAGISHSLFVMNSSQSIIGNEFRACGLSRHNQLGSREGVVAILTNNGNMSIECLLKPSSCNQNVFSLSQCQDSEFKITLEEQKKLVRDISRANKRRQQSDDPTQRKKKSSLDPVLLDETPFSEKFNSKLDFESFTHVITMLQQRIHRENEEWHRYQREIADDAEDDTTLDKLENPQFSSERYELLLSNAVWDCLENSYTKDQINQKYMTSLDIILRAVNGFSDYREIFADLFYYYMKGIQEMDENIAIKCVKVCSILYNTHNVDIYYHSHLVEIILQRALDALTSFHTSTSTSAKNSKEMIKRIQFIVKIMDLLLQSGDEYQQEFQRCVLKENFYNLLLLELSNTSTGAGTGTSPDDMTKKKFSDIEQLFQRLVSIFSNNLQEKFHLPESTGGLVVSSPSSSTLPNEGDDVLGRNYEYLYSQLNKEILCNSLLDGYNSICEDTDENLQFQFQLTSNQLTYSAMSILYHMNEGTSEKHTSATVLLESIMWFNLLLAYWDESNEEHMRVKREIACLLKDYGIIEGVMRQMEFWAIEWNGMFGDCGRGIFECLKYLFFYFPEEMRVRLNQSDPRVLEMIKSASQQQNHRISDSGTRSITSSAIFIMNSL